MEVWGGKELPVGTEVIKDFHTDDILAEEDLYKYISKEIDHDDLMEMIETLIPVHTLLHYFDMAIIPLGE